MKHALDFTHHAHDVLKAREIRYAWVFKAVNFPEAMLRDIHDAQLTHALRLIPERGNRVLRVVYNHVSDPPRVVTAYFDRTLKGKL